MSFAVFALVASPLLGFAGVLLGQRSTRRGALELDRWRKHEETMRLLRWATDMAVDPAWGRAEVGTTVLEELLLAPLLDEEDQSLVAAVALAVARTRMLDEDGRSPPW